MGRQPLESLAVIDRDALEAKARELEEAVFEAKDSIRTTAMKRTLGIAAAVIAAFIAGRKRGRGKGARIEIHRL